MAEPVSIRKISSILDEMNQMQDRIMRRAYDLFERNGRLFGRDLDHWLQAERELLWKPAVELREAGGEFVLEAAVSVSPRAALTSLTQKGWTTFIGAGLNTRKPKKQSAWRPLMRSSCGASRPRIARSSQS